MGHDPANLTFAFQDGELRIGTPTLHMRFRWHPKAVAECRVPGQKTWSAYWPSMRLLRSDHAGALAGEGTPAQAKEAAFRAFRQEIPDDLARRVEPFESYQWPLLKLLQAQPAAVDLAKANPVLAYCLANNAEFRGTTPEAAAEQAVWYSHRKQKVILGWLGFEASDSLARWFRKILPGVVYPSLMRRLRGTLKHQSELLGVLAHLPVASRGVLELVSHPDMARLATPKLLHEVARRSDEALAEQVAETIHAGLTLWREMGREDAGLRPFQSIARVLRFQTDMDREYQAFQERREAARVEEARRLRLAAAARVRERRELAAQARHRALVRQRPFPPPPLPGTDTIIPLTSDEALRREADEQQHCVSAYGLTVREGNVYCYKVLAPQRATLSIAKAPDGSWRRSQLVMARNAPTSCVTVNAVEEWLEQHRVSV